MLLQRLEAARNERVTLVLLLLQVWLLEDDRNLLAVLSCRNQGCRLGGEAGVLLSPDGLAGEKQHSNHTAANFDLF